MRFDSNSITNKYALFKISNPLQFSIFLGNAQYLEQQQQMQNGEIKRKESLSPPPKREVTWSEYIQSPAGQHPVLGRASKCKESSRAFKATVAMSEDFPLTVEMLLNVLEVIAPQFKHFQKLRDFIEMKLPPGFPVKVDIPVKLKKKNLGKSEKLKELTNELLLLFSVNLTCFFNIYLLNPSN